MAWIKLHSASLESPCFAHPGIWKLWTWMLLKANWKDAHVPFEIGRGITTVHVKRGQFIFGRHKAEEKLNVDGSTIYKWLSKLQEWEQIIIESNSQYSIITICNYDIYQSDEKESSIEVTSKEQVSNNGVAAEEQQSNTKKNPIEDLKEIEVIDKFPFVSFWDLYDKKIDTAKCESKWKKITDTDKELIMAHVPKYVEVTPEGSVPSRKNPATYLNNKCWLDSHLPVKKLIGEKQEKQLSASDQIIKYGKFIADMTEEEKLKFGIK